jgi:hypothetical protein
MGKLLLLKSMDALYRQKGGNAHDHTVHETGVIRVSVLSIFYAPGAARGMRYHATTVATFFPK